jgi:predicted ribosome quality control (RQC) complex YloA/Tae2 family protein
LGVALWKTAMATKMSRAWKSNPVEVKVYESYNTVIEKFRFVAGQG